jgi:hypothetical protein
MSKRRSYSCVILPNTLSSTGLIALPPEILPSRNAMPAPPETLLSRLML